MASRFLELSRGARITLATLAAMALAWRVIVTGLDALYDGDIAAALPATNSPQEPQDLEANWRKRLALNPADFGALLAVAQQMATDGKATAAREAAAEALRLAPNDQGTLIQIGYLYLRLGDEAQGLATLRRFVELYPDQADKMWPTFVKALDADRQADFFTRAALENPLWWAGFMGHACENATVRAIERAFTTRLSAGLATADERRCVIDRLQREGKWTTAYELWQAGLPAGQRDEMAFVFNGGFESPLSNLGFDWIAPKQEGVIVAPELTEGASGRRALHVTFVNKRYGGPPVYEYLILGPRKYRLEGRGRADGLSSWLGLQWGLYCHDAKGSEGLQLARSDPLVGSSDWSYFRQDFVVPKDCPVQMLRLELANPQRNAKTGGNVAVRLRGSVWFDDLKVGIVD